MLGPGDIVQIALFGEVNLLFQQEVAPEGSLLVPRMGIIDVLGLTLDQAEESIRDLVARYYRSAGVSLTLSRVRSFKIFLLGDVGEPGVRTANSATRVSEIVPLTRENGILHRNVVLTRTSGDTLRIDLARFAQMGDLSQNPLLREGDVLLIPSIDQTVQVYGPVAFPGTYEYRDGETLAELLRVANGGTGFAASAADSVRLSRFDSDAETTVFTFQRGEATGPQGMGFTLQPFDAVYLAAIANYREQKTATVRGQVRRPGTYPIRADTTTVRQLIEMAGGFTSQASLVNSTLQRRRVENTGAGGSRPLESIPPEYLSDHDRRILQSISYTDTNNVVVDFQTLFAGGVDAYDQTLRDRDLLDVPEARQEVLVAGAVVQPGIVGHVPGQPIDYFIGLAGGYSQNADARDLVVLKARTGARVGRRDVGAVEPGDQIVVPFAEPTTFMERVQMVQSVAGIVSGLILTVIGIGQLF
jgi:protein involved in polysaccharide export with SLBB domain